MELQSPMEISSDPMTQGVCACRTTGFDRIFLKPEPSTCPLICSIFFEHEGKSTDLTLKDNLNAEFPAMLTFTMPLRAEAAFRYSGFSVLQWPHLPGSRGGAAGSTSLSQMGQRIRQACNMLRKAVAWTSTWLCGTWQGGGAYHGAKNSTRCAVALGDCSSWRLLASISITSPSSG